jgi:hypothetical protein
VVGVGEIRCPGLSANDTARPRLVRTTGGPPLQEEERGGGQVLCERGTGAASGVFDKSSWAVELENEALVVGAREDLCVEWDVAGTKEAVGRSGFGANILSIDGFASQRGLGTEDCGADWGVAVFTDKRREPSELFSGISRVTSGASFLLE